MKLLGLHLHAFGPFSDLRLDFSSPANGLHVIFGRNEAGKSTALRAIISLLFGIDARTTDDHRHAKGELRIGGRLEIGGGEARREEREVVRRKGNKNTLLDENGAALDEQWLRRALGGIDRALFMSAFALDHPRLVEGGRALLEGKGEVGQSLFVASGSGRSIRAVLASLSKETEELWSPSANARTPLLNRRLRRYSELRKEAADRSLRPAAWRELDQALGKAKADRAIAVEKWQAAQASAARLRRLGGALTLLGQRRQLAAERAALGEFVRLPEGAAEERREAERQIADALPEEQGLAAELAELAKQRASLQVPTLLLGEKRVIARLRDRLGSHAKAAQDLTRLRVELEHVEGEARGLLKRLGREVSLSEAHALRLDVATEARIGKLATSHEARVQQLAQVERSQAAAARKLAAAEEQLALLAPARAPDAISELQQAIERARRPGELEQRQRTLEADAAREELRAQASLAGLGLWSGLVDEVAGIAAPPVESMGRFERRYDSAEADATRIAGELVEERRKEEARIRQVDELQRAGDVPTETQLDEARASRQQGWQLVRRAWLGKTGSELLVAAAGGSAESTTVAVAYEESVAHADAIADRLRREADRVAHLARLLADEEAGARKIAQLVEAETRAARALRTLDEEWQALWRAPGIAPLPPREMRAWLGRKDKLVEQVERAELTRAKRDEIGREVAALRAGLDKALSRVGESPIGSLAATLGHAAAVLDRIMATERHREDLSRAVVELSSEVAQLGDERQAAKAALDIWLKEWASSVAALGLSPGATPDEAQAVLGAQRSLQAKLDDATSCRRRIEGIERDADEFAAEVRALCDVHGPDPAKLAAEEAGRALVDRYDQGALDHTRQVELDAQIEASRRRLAQLTERRTQAQLRLKALERAAGATDALQLAEIEERSRVGRKLEAELASVEERLREFGEGATVAELADEAKAISADALPAQLAELDEVIEKLGAERSLCEERVGGLGQELRALDGSAAASDAAGEAEDELAAIRGGVERYLGLKVAEWVLAREVERHRERNQGPVLVRAGELFARLTLSAFCGLRTDFLDDKDEATLRCVRANGQPVAVEGLSEGTRDQLFLALRLASLERQLASGPALPLVVDDLLIHFDDERAQATLEVLGELGTRTQILFFTHHARLVELAQKSVPVERLRVHRLAASGNDEQAKLP